MPVYLLSDDLIFPSPPLASEEGLLAVGGDLSQERLLLAYRMGIFPWYSEDEPIMWWSPDPRLVLYPAELNVSKSLEKTIKKRLFKVTMDQAFEAVIKACAHSRTRIQQGTWIVNDMIAAYCRPGRPANWSVGFMVYHWGRVFLENLCLRASAMPPRLLLWLWLNTSRP
jgi:leucyl/phenylalanyl-tRNA--protein transferase